MPVTKEEVKAEAERRYQRDLEAIEAEQAKKRARAAQRVEENINGFPQETIDILVETMDKQLLAGIHSTPVLAGLNNAGVKMGSAQESEIIAYGKYVADIYTSIGWNVSLEKVDSRWTGETWLLTFR